MASVEPRTLHLGMTPISARSVALTAAESSFHVKLNQDALTLMTRSRDVLEHAAAAGQRVYGLNTLLGSGRDTAVEEKSLLAYQIQVVRYHNSGVGSYLDRPAARAVILARLIGFSRGGSGVRPETAAFYGEMLNRGVLPAIPREGSVGSSDLTQLAAVAAVAIGEGQAFDADGTLIPGAKALADAGLQPLVLAPGEALALVSANAYSVGVGTLALVRLQYLARLADVALSLSLETIARYDGGGNLSPFSSAIQAAKAVNGQGDSAAAVRHLISGGWMEDVRPEVSVQDALSFRAAPQTHGAFRSLVAQLGAALEVELNGRGDNPLVDVESGLMVSGGNFQPMQLALAFEGLRVAVAHVGISSERRIAKLYPPQRAIRARHLQAASTQAPSARSGPGAGLESAPAAGLAQEELPGLLWYSAAGLLAELKFLAAPATLGAPTLSADVEDHSTLAPLALQQLEKSVEVLEKLLAIEALTASYLLLEAGAAQALGKGTAVVVGRLADVLADRPAAPDLVERARIALRDATDRVLPETEEGAELR
ncbi:histidine ammonia-lyase [Paenarthrobacter nicotinovorans]|uniref:aromatic amino acid ammonia-lyase n=1 Tax=Micrococcaceae TaxID=1268 RepID=UPI000876998E|nr:MULTISPECIES: aromatic amino acid ammonia-lyase [Micrococcaceae]MDR6438609.1 histidine ammonia-lyase [Paenarthrobacter nicotinovorans]SCZ59707.1 histidine ammonia-lyase [Arthrobacter sp. UNCCL28]